MKLSGSVDRRRPSSFAVAICICTRNRPQELRAALRSILESSRPPEQIIVSDDSDQTSAHATASACLEIERLHYQIGPRRGLAANRNSCIASLRRDIGAVVLLDDDARLSRDFIECGERLMVAGDGHTIITGCELRDGLEVCPANLSFWGFQEVHPKNPADFHGICINSALFPASLFERVQFDEALAYGSEEADICAQAEQVGFRIVFAPQLVNVHDRSPTGRAAYDELAEASRLYATYKRYRWIERRRWKAILYAALAPCHAVGSALLGGQRTDVVRSLRAIIRAYSLLGYGRPG